MQVMHAPMSQHTPMEPSHQNVLPYQSNQQQHQQPLQHQACNPTHPPPRASNNTGYSGAMSSTMPSNTQVLRPPATPTTLRLARFRTLWALGWDAAGRVGGACMAQFDPPTPQTVVLRVVFLTA